MAEASTRFPTKMECDICGKYTGTAQQVGSHIRIQHGAAVTEKIASLIDKAGDEGTNRKDIMAATGWKQNRVGNVIKKLQKAGVVKENEDRVVFAAGSFTEPESKTDDDSPAPLKAKAKSTARKARGKSVNATAQDVADAASIVGYIQGNQTRAVKAAAKEALDKLIDSHKGEYVSNFTMALLDAQLPKMSDEKVEAVARALVS